MMMTQTVHLTAVEMSALKFWSPFDVAMMKKALNLAKQGAALGEVPVGAVLTVGERIIATGYNCPISSQDPTAHAEVVAIRAACQALKNYRLPADSTLYVSLEPCTMCFGSLVHARVGRVVFGAYEPKAGVVLSQLELAKQGFYNHSIAIQGGLLARESSQILSEFFKQRRAQKRLNQSCQKQSG